MEPSGLPIDLFVWIKVIGDGPAASVLQNWEGQDGRWGVENGATCQLMTNIGHFQPICFLYALDEVSDESNL